MRFGTTPAKIEFVEKLMIISTTIYGVFVKLQIEKFFCLMSEVSCDLQSKGRGALICIEGGEKRRKAYSAH